MDKTIRNLNQQEIVMLSPDITTEQVLSSIDFEIDRINKESQRPGWTPWAIYGAIAVIFWSLIALAEKGNLNLVNIVQFFLAIYVFHTSLKFAFGAYIEIPNRYSNYLTITPFKRSVNRKRHIFEIVCNILFLFLSIYYSTNVLLLQIIIVALNFLLIISAGSVFLWLAAENFGVPTKESQPRKTILFELISFLVAFVGFSFFSIGAFGYFWAVWQRGGENLPWNDLKISALLFALQFLTYKYLDTSNSNPALTDLISLRRAISFGEIPLGRAVIEAKRIFGDLTVPEYLNETNVSLKQTIQLCINAYEHGIQNLERMSEILNYPSEEFNGTEILLKTTDSFLKLHEKILNQIRECTDLFNYYKKEFEKEHKRIEFFVDKDDELERLKNIVQNGQLQIEEKAKQFNSLIESANLLLKQNSSVLFPSSDEEDLQNEIAAWEAASDEDLLNFERELSETK